MTEDKKFTKNEIDVIRRFIALPAEQRHIITSEICRNIYIEMFKENYRPRSIIKAIANEFGKSSAWAYQKVHNKEINPKP